MADPLAFAHRCTQRWFETSFSAPTFAQVKGWPPIVEGRSTLLLAPTGSGKTLSAFLVAIDRLMFGPPREGEGVRVLYVSPLKALGVDVERNLRAPLNGIRIMAERAGAEHRVPSVGVRSGDTPQADRERMRKHPPQILITTPESFYLLLTSRSRDMLRGVETVIVDEIHTMVSGKRGAHLFLSLERLERLRDRETPLQRIGLSATQRPLEEVGRLLGGLDTSDLEKPTPRPVSIIDASHPKAFDLRVEVPVEDMARLAHAEDRLEDPANAGPRPHSIWPSIHPRLVELIRAHRSTMIFVNSRRLAERLALALNELAEEEIARAHHGSVAKDIRADIEDRLKRGVLPAIVATSSLELGIDMGAVDLVIQIEAPPSVASGIQRIGRGGHHVGAVSRGVIFPKFRGDLLACAAVTEHVIEGRVEATYYPRNPLDVVAQQIVAIVAEGPITVDEVRAIVCGAAPFAELPVRSLTGVLDMLSGRYPSDELGELRARITWDRIAGILRPRRGARMLAIANGGTIPDRGLFGVFLADSEKPARVGELDEEMVFESRVGDVFLLGASSWRIEEITHQQVLVSPAPGEPGKMPFWHGDRPGRPLEFGRAIGALTRELCALPRADAVARLVDRHALDERAAENLMRYLDDQADATGRLPTDRALVIERFMDEIGDWVVTVHSPFGARVHAPWSTAVSQRLMHELGLDPDAMWSDDGMVFRLPDADEPPDDSIFLPAPDEVERLITDQLASTSLFAARFRENAGRSLLLPKRRPGQRTPLWAQRRKSAQLLKVASRFRDFPVVLETYRECLRDVFDVPGLVGILEDVRDRRILVSSVQTKTPSPFASSLLFNYVASFIYEGDVPLAERRTQMLSLDHAQLRELLGEPELRQLLDRAAILEVEARLQRLTGYRVKHADGLHDLLLGVGDLTREAIEARSEADPVEWIEELVASRRAVPLQLAGELRYIAVEDSGRYRDGLGVVPPPGLPQALLEPVLDPLGDLIGRYARTHGPFTAAVVAARFALGEGAARAALERLASQDRVVEGEFLPGGRTREWVAVDVLRQIKQRSLATLRQEVEPVEPDALARFALDWHGIGRPRRSGPDSLVLVIEQLQGAPIPASSLEEHTLPSRLEGYDRRDLDELCSSGEVLWRGVGSLGPKDGRIALYLADHYRFLAIAPTRVEGELAAAVRAHLVQRGAVFFRDLVQAVGAFGADVLETIWDMVWAGEVTNDTLMPLRSLYGGAERPRGPRRKTRPTPRSGPPGSEGRWSLLPSIDGAGVTPTERAEALATQLLERHGVLTREAVRAESIPGGFAAVYPVLRAMEEAGRVRRGYFVAGLGATQFALPGAEDRLRVHRDPDPDANEVRLLAADDPANVYGAALDWPARDGARPQRTAGARIVLHDGRLVGYIGRTGHSVITFLPSIEIDRRRAIDALVRGLRLATGEGRNARAVLIKRVDGEDPAQSAIANDLRDAGFAPTSRGFHRRCELN